MEEKPVKFRVTIGLRDECVAVGSINGERRKYKAVLLKVRTSTYGSVAPLLVRYIGMEDGSKSPLLMPAVHAHRATRQAPLRWPTCAASWWTAATCES